MLCDEPGLGKSVQVLTLALARPPPAGWAVVPPLPEAAAGALPIKATLLVAPAALLDQWEAEVAKHVREGDPFTHATYVGLASAAAEEHAFAPPAESVPGPGDEGDDASEGRRPKRSRKGVERYAPSQAAVGAASAAGASASDASDGAGGAEGASSHSASTVEVLARTRRSLFVRGGAPVPVEQCDLVLCSFETLRSELKKARPAGTSADAADATHGSPLGTLGFWRIVLDEAQLVSNTNSAAAVVASSLLRRHAW